MNLEVETRVDVQKILGRKSADTVPLVELYTVRTVIFRLVKGCWRIITIGGLQDHLLAASLPLLETMVS
jgi:hypothetical protein